MILKPLFGFRVSQTIERVFVLGLVMALAVALPATPDGLVALGTAVAIAAGTVDAQTLLSDAQAFTADAVSTNTYDTGVSGGRDFGAGEPMCVVITIDVAAIVNDTDETYAFELIQSANANLSSADVLASVSFTNAQAAADLKAGSQVVLPIPSGRISKRYLGVNYNVAGTTPGATVTAVIKPMSMVENRKAYPDGFTIS